MLDIQLAVAKTNKYASRESGDTVEVVERPHGGFSVVLADGQGSGHSAKNVSHLVTSKAITMIKDGARDGAVARSAHDYLYTYKSGKVSATLVIVTVDLATQTLVLSRNSHCPILLSLPGSPDLRVLDEQCSAIGIYVMTKPVITELPIEATTYVVTYSDGLMDAGERDNRQIDAASLFKQALSSGITSASGIADYLLAKALEADANRPADDMSVIALAIQPSPQPESNRVTPQVRRLVMEMPL
ncbi:MAG: PP2C family protein-serine/threonine phosphatase [Chloroflexota bacterium]